MKLIPLTQGKYAIVDDEDFHDLSRYCWYFCSLGYAQRKGPRIKNEKRTTIRMHRFIMKPKTGDYVDHINGNRLDNRRENLRIATNRQNAMNSKMHSNNKIGVKGVSLHRASGLFHARIRQDGIRKSLGYFKTAEEAGLAYDKAATMLFGEFALTNEMIRFQH